MTIVGNTDIAQFSSEGKAKGGKGINVFYNASMGDNNGRERYPGCTYGTHAEISAIKRFNKRPTWKWKHKHVNLLVIRASPSGKLGNSRPCYKCLNELNKFQHYGNVKIKYIYYSTRDGTITREKLSDMIAEAMSGSHMHVSGRFRN